MADPLVDLLYFNFQVSILILEWVPEILKQILQLKKTEKVVATVWTFYPRPIFLRSRFSKLRRNFFQRPNFLKPKPPKIGKSLETEKFRNRYEALRANLK